MRRTKIRGLEVSRLGLGCMGMSAFYDGAGSDDAESVRTIHRALDLGINLVDTAEIYGPFTNEELVGRALADRRDEAVLATKFGLVSHRDEGIRKINSRPENIRTAIEGSLRRLDTDRIDLYYQHRVDPSVPIEEVVGVLGELVGEGKVVEIGLSEAGPETIRRAHATHPVAAVQSEYSLWTRGLEAEILPLLRELGIALVAYSPLGRGFLTGRFSSPGELSENDFRAANPRFRAGNFERNLELVRQVEELADAPDATPAQVALAWLLAQGEDVVPIPGTKRVSRLQENAAAAALELSAEQLAALDELGDAVGDRYEDMTPLER